MYRNGAPIPVDQINNSYIFPGLGLGGSGGERAACDDEMFMASARALAALSPAREDPEGRLLPPVSEIRGVSVAVAKAVARQAQADGVAECCTEEALAARICSNVWKPVYRRYRPAVRVSAIERS